MKRNSNRTIKVIIGLILSAILVFNANKLYEKLYPKIVSINFHLPSKMIAEFENGKKCIYCVENKHCVSDKLDAFVDSYNFNQFSDNNFIRFIDKGKYGFMNFEGKIVIPATYNMAYPFKEAQTRQIICPPIYDDIVLLSKNVFACYSVFSDNGDGYYFLMDHHGKLLSQKDFLKIIKMKNY